MKLMKIRFLPLLTTSLAAVLLLHSYAVPRSETRKLDGKIDEYISAAERVYNLTGSVAIAQGGSIIDARGLGKADFESDRDNTPTTRFAIGSVTKQFTAAAILQLQEKGMLSLDDTIDKFFPDFPEDIASRVTIRQMLTHTSGLANYTSTPAFVDWGKLNPTLERQLDLIATLPLDFEPGTEHRYSNSGYKVLEAIIVKLTDMRWDKYVLENILIPSGMTASGYELAEVDEELRAVGYTGFEESRKRAEQWPAGIAGGAGALYSTVLDLVKWDEALRSGKILQPESLELMFTPAKQNYAFGWIVDSVGSYQRTWHDGQIFGFSAMYVRIPEEEIAIAVLSNNDQVATQKIGLTLSGILTNQPYDLPIKKEPVAVNPDRYHDYVGAYDLGEGVYRLITTEKGRLYSQRAGSPQFEIFPEGNDKFFYSTDNATTVFFVRDQSGNVVSQIFHQGGVDTEHKKLPDDQASALMPKYEIAEVDPRIYEEYVGEYQLAPNFTITVRHSGSEIFVQATGQSEFEIFPSSETRFFLKVVEAHIEFFRGDDGEVERLILYQGGREMPGLKIR